MEYPDKKLSFLGPLSPSPTKTKTVSNELGVGAKLYF